MKFALALPLLAVVAAVAEPRVTAAPRALDNRGIIDDITSAGEALASGAKTIGQDIASGAQNAASHITSAAVAGYTAVTDAGKDGASKVVSGAEAGASAVVSGGQTVASTVKGAAFSFNIPTLAAAGIAASVIALVC